MSYLPELRDALHTTAARYAAGQSPARRRSWWRRAASRTILVAAVLPSLALVVFILTSIHTTSNTIAPGGSPGGGPVLTAWIRADHKAAQAMVVHDPRCRQGNPIPGPQRMLEQRPGPQFTSVLGVLRDPAPAGARVTAVRIRQLHVLAQDIYVRFARHGVIDGVTYYLVPAAKDVGGAPLTDRCVALWLTAFTEQIARLPGAQRPRALAWERKQIRERRQRPGVVLLTLTPGGQGADYRPLSALRDRPFMGGSGGNDRGTTSALLLPNQVASVTARYGAQSHPGRVSRPVTVTRPVVNNLVIFVFRGAWDPPRFTYRSANGKVLWSTPKP